MKNLMKQVTMKGVAVVSTTSFLLNPDARVLMFQDDNSLLKDAVRQVLYSNETTSSFCEFFTSDYEPNFKRCTTTVYGYSPLELTVSTTLLNSSNSSKDLACATLNGRACRGSYFCTNGNLFVDCRNLFQPGDPCGAIDCDGNCVDYPPTIQPLDFGYGNVIDNPPHWIPTAELLAAPTPLGYFGDIYINNDCATLGFKCFQDFSGFNSSCFWLKILGNGDAVHVGTYESPSSNGNGYSPTCFAKVNDFDFQCTNCSTSDNGTYFDCSDWSDDPCAIQDGPCTCCKNTTILLTAMHLADLAPNATCVDHVNLSNPNYIECKSALDDGWEMTVMQTIPSASPYAFDKYHNGNVMESLLILSNPNLLCMKMHGLPCRASYLCPNGNVAWDCRNVMEPGAPCGGMDCHGNCLDYYPSMMSEEPLLFDYNNNSCGRLGYYCEETQEETIIHCYWLNILPNGKHVRVSVAEYSNDRGGCGNYMDSCNASVDGKACSSCSAYCFAPSGNYAAINCQNVIGQDDPWANQSCGSYYDGYRSPYDGYRLLSSSSSTTAYHQYTTKQLQDELPMAPCAPYFLNDTEQDGSNNDTEQEGSKNVSRDNSSGCVRVEIWMANELASAIVTVLLLSFLGWT